MRRICLIVLVVVLVVPIAASAAERAGDGSLAISGASGTIYIQGRGVVYGHFDQGTLMVLRYTPDDPSSVPSVSSSKARFSKGTGVFTASDVRFLLPSGRYTLELIASGVDVSAVGTGTVVATSPSETGTVLPFGTAPNDGTISVNGGKPLTLTNASTSSSFGGLLTTTPSGK
ncbi:MAG TPA: hypothetical protein VG265_02400 [Gaiellaceae bacterium]|jgi:hypothetical protein|nr:hypothetical protein [Gaiellaceae bacterium]